jgi:hypothetical protein
VTTDQTQCGQWATQQTGYNPNAPAMAAPVSPTPPPKNLGLFGGISRRDERREERWERREERQEQRGAGQGSSSAPAPNPQQTDAYNRALDACLTARGYTVR